MSVHKWSWLGGVAVLYNKAKVKQSKQQEAADFITLTTDMQSTTNKCRSTPGHESWELQEKCLETHVPDDHTASVAARRAVRVCSFHHGQWSRHC